MTDAGTTRFARDLVLLFRQFWGVRMWGPVVLPPTPPPPVATRPEPRAKKNPAKTLRVICFGIFEFSPQTGELRRQGLKVKLEPQASNRKSTRLNSSHVA